MCYAGEVVRLAAVSDKQTAFMRRVGIDVGIVRRSEDVGQPLPMTAAGPFAADPAHVPQAIILRQRLEDRILGTFAVEFQKVDIVDANLAKPLPKFLGRDRRDANAEGRYCKKLWIGVFRRRLVGV
jgi:hypothetical protein